MAIVPMKLVTLVGPVEKFDDVVLDRVVDGPFHPENALRSVGNVKSLYAFSGENPYAEPLRRAESLAKATGLGIEYRELSSFSYEGEEGISRARTLLDQLEKRFSGLLKEREENQDPLLDSEHLMHILQDVKETHVRLEELYHLKYTKFQFGRAPKETYNLTKPQLDSHESLFFLPTGEESGFVYGIVLTTRAQAGRADELLEKLRFERIRVPGDSTLADVQSFLDHLEQHHQDLEQETKEQRRLVNDNEQILRILDHIQDINIHLEEFFDLKYTKFRFGRIRRDTYDKLRPHLEEEDTLFFLPTSLERDFVYGMVLTPRQYADKTDMFLASLHFERIRIPDKVHGTPHEAYDSLKQENEAAKARCAQLERELLEFKQRVREDFYAAVTYLRRHNTAFELRTCAARTKSNFYLTGWVPEDELEHFTGQLDDYREVTYSVEDPGEQEDQSPPIKLKNNPVFRVFEPYVSMYGLPNYNEVDPTPLMAITYTILFGAMFGDVGQGLMLGVVGYLMYKLKGMWLGRILVCAGVASVAFGFVYGSVFGYEDLLPYEGFKVMEGDNTNLILIIAVAVGAVLISVAMILNIVNGIRQKDFIKLFFAPNGVAGFIFYWAVIFCVLPLLGFGESVLTPWYLILFLGLPLLLIFLKEPLGKLMARRPDWMPEDGFLNYALENLFELIEVLLSYVTNTISFLRVGAFALSHAGMMMVVFLLAKGTGQSPNMVVVVLGNVVVMAIEGLLVGIQVLRLEFYELFGRFYSGEGTPYSPVKVDYHLQDK